MAKLGRTCGRCQRLRGVELLGALEQDPAGSDVLVATARPVAAMRMGECSRCYQQAATAWRHFAVLVQKLGFAFGEIVVEVDRPQQVPMQRLRIGMARKQLAVPVRITALIGTVTLQVDIAWHEYLPGQRTQFAIAHGSDVVGLQATQLAVITRNLKHQRGNQGIRIAAQVGGKPGQHGEVQSHLAVAPGRLAADGDVARMLQLRIDAATDLAGCRLSAAFESLDQRGALRGAESIFVDLYEITVHAASLRDRYALAPSACW